MSNGHLGVTLAHIRRLKRHGNDDLGPAVRLAQDSQIGPHIASTLPHSYESEMARAIEGVVIEANPVVLNGEPESAVAELKGDAKDRCSSVLDGITHCFLRDPNQLEFGRGSGAERNALDFKLERKRRAVNGAASHVRELV